MVLPRYVVSPPEPLGQLNDHRMPFIESRGESEERCAPRRKTGQVLGDCG